MKRIQRLIRKIKNLIRWFPVIWNDKDFDHYFIEKILHEKLRNTYNFFISNDSYTDWDAVDEGKALKALRICITILDRKLNSFYIMNLQPDGELSLKQVKDIMKVEERDQKLLGYLLGKYMSWWWD